MKRAGKDQKQRLLLETAHTRENTILKRGQIIRPVAALGPAPGDRLGCSDKALWGPRRRRIMQKINVSNLAKPQMRRDGGPKSHSCLREQPSVDQMKKKAEESGLLEYQGPPRL